MRNESHPSTWDLEVSPVSLSDLFLNEFQGDKLKFRAVAKFLISTCRFNKNFRSTIARESDSSNLGLTDFGRLFEISQHHQKSIGGQITSSGLKKNKLDVYVDAGLKADPDQSVDLPFFTSSFGRIRDQYGEIFSESGCRNVSASQSRDEVFEKVFQRRIEVAKEIMIVDQYGFDGSAGDQSGVKWFLKMIQKTNPKLSNLVLVGAYNKSKERQSPLSMKDYKDELFFKMKKLMGQYDWGEGMRRYLSVIDPDPDTHQTHIFIDRNYRYTWDYRFRLFAGNKIKSDQKIYFSCSFGDPDALELKWYKKFRSKAMLV